MFFLYISSFYRSTASSKYFMCYKKSIRNLNSNTITFHLSLADQYYLCYNQWSQIKKNNTKTFFPVFYSAAFAFFCPESNLKNQGIKRIKPSARYTFGQVFNHKSRALYCFVVTLAMLLCRVNCRFIIIILHPVLRQTFCTDLVIFTVLQTIGTKPYCHVTPGGIWAYGAAIV